MNAAVMNREATASGSIVGVVAAVPARVITNADCPDPAAADAAAKLTGVRERRWVSPGQSARTLCTDAARRLLEGLGWQASSIDVLLYVTQTPDGDVPADVYRIAHDLGLPAGCACVQVNWSCAGYVYGLWSIMRLLQPGWRGLLLVGDATSTIADPDDRATSPLFGDAGSATAVSGTGPEQHFVMGSDGSGADKLYKERAGFLRMNGAEVFNFTLRVVPQLVAEVREYGRPDYLLFHQAQAFILRHLIKKMPLAEAGYSGLHVPSNVARFGNCSCASIPLLWCSDLAAETMANVDYPQSTRLALIGFGAGWAFAGASITVEPLAVVELIEV